MFMRNMIASGPKVRPIDIVKLVTVLTTQSGVSVTVGHPVIAARRLARFIRLIADHVPTETQFVTM